ncbi:GntR family transcriptional regulator|uniref:Transcriptional regulator, GntR family n=1 Tax=Dendrosporobacter quercicolus TaxID=146817 RepID=A0A1G9U7E2_9FIRM|nr:TrkA C-terminal domain-containing protein [Dendrosporobacter quercicolus]NSL49972.1 GntR family transcriptional regulator [Dendrosporobacter quercicolus DSM 1736]SDM55752.1 transcriptional regulator, GntR family [Dendrosporobacter quercicolus]
MAAMYLSIATDIAQRIINDEFAIGSRIAGRTLLASHYNVSSETIRKAVALLKDANVVNVSQGKEITVLSVEEAYRFIDHHKSMQSVYSLRQELEILLEKKNEIDKRLENVLNDIIGYSDRLKNLNPYNPIEVKIPANSHLVGRTIADIKLWQHTGATVVAIRRDTDIIISPGPLAVIEADDRLVIVGNAEVLQRSTDFAHKTSLQSEPISLN